MNCMVLGCNEPVDAWLMIEVGADQLPVALVCARHRHLDSFTVEQTLGEPPVVLPGGTRRLRRSGTSPVNPDWMIVASDRDQT